LRGKQRQDLLEFLHHPAAIREGRHMGQGCVAVRIFHGARIIRKRHSPLSPTARGMASSPWAHGCQIERIGWSGVPGAGPPVGVGDRAKPYLTHDLEKAKEHSPRATHVSLQRLRDAIR
jgi:hypothetical protein